MSNSGSLPPLPRLQAFESAARLGSFTAAARELGSTQSAISQHIKQLEVDLGTPLFQRVRRGVQLTRAGNDVVQWASEGLGILTEGYRRARQPRRHQCITLSADYALGTYWLLPRLRHFRQHHPDLDVRLVTAQHSVSPDEGEVDIGLVFGNGYAMSEPTRLLFPEIVVPVCSPALLERHPDVGHWWHLPLLELEAEDHPPWFDWDRLCSALDVPGSPGEPELIFNNYTLLLQAAISGQGVSIGWSPFIEPLLENHSLRALTDRVVESDRGYHIVFPSNRPLTPQVERFIDWLVKEGEITQQEQSLERCLVPD